MTGEQTFGVVFLTLVATAALVFLFKTEWQWRLHKKRNPTAKELTLLRLFDGVVLVGSVAMIIGLVTRVIPD